MPETMIVQTPFKGELSERRFVLDGTNITLLHGPQRPRVDYVLSVAHYLLVHGSHVECFFDANTPYLLADAGAAQLATFERLTQEPPLRGHFAAVASGTEADAQILGRAKALDGDVISNDKFRDRARKNRWIWKRRHGLSVSDGNLLITSLGAEVPVSPDMESSLQDCAVLLGKMS